MLKVFRK